MNVRSLHRLVLVVVAAGGLACGSAWPQSPDSAEKAAKDSVRSLGLQTELPHAKPKQESRPIRLTIPEELVWVALVCAILVLLYALRDQIPFWRRSSDGGWGEPEAGTEAGAGAGPVDALSAADELSRDGRFVEAMHMLLLQSLAEIRNRLGMQFADSLTSREILRTARLPQQGRTSLREIVAAVEWTYFGGYPAKLADYTACRRSFENLRHVLGGAA
jgi:Domain of unknown function (DUF4129)